jgi:hypothetical protein
MIVFKNFVLGVNMKSKRQLIIGLSIIALAILYVGWSYVASTKTIKPVENYQQKGDEQFRNNAIVISRESNQLFTDDPVFKEFKDTGKSPVEYEQWFVDSAAEKGIDSVKLQKSLDKAKGYRFWIDGITRYPVIIETAKYKNRDSFVIVFTWELSDVAANRKTVGPLGHIFIVSIDANSQEVISELHCN